MRGCSVDSAKIVGEGIMVMTMMRRVSKLGKAIALPSGGAFL